MNLRKVLFLSQARGVGGAERVTLSALARVSEVRVMVAAPAAVAAFARELSLEAHELVLGRARLAAPLIPGGLAVAKLARKIGAEAIYANQLHAIPHGLAARLVGSAPLIAHNHEILSGLPSRLVEIGLGRWAAAVIAPSRAAAPRVPKGLLHIVPTGIALDRFAPPERFPEKVVGTVGRPSPGKGMHEFIRIAREVRAQDSETRFVMVGGPAFSHEDGVFDALRLEAREADIDTVGVVEDTAPFYRRMSVFVHAGEPEAFPTTVIEAMATGLPVVAFRWGGIVEIIDHEATGFLVPGGDYNAMADAILTLISDNNLRAEMSDAARSVAEARFGVQAFSDRLEQIILAVE